MKPTLCLGVVLARAFTLALICQCHDQEALNDVNAAGAKSVADYLRTK
jgi:hypothetical protein